MKKLNRVLTVHNNVSGVFNFCNKKMFGTFPIQRVYALCIAPKIGNIYIVTLFN